MPTLFIKSKFNKTLSEAEFTAKLKHQIMPRGQFVFKNNYG